MLIRGEQMRVFQRAAESEFARAMVRHMQEFAPELCGVAGEKAVREVVESGIRRAKACGFTNRGTAQLYLEMMFALGNEFDSDPMLPWAGEILGAAGEQRARADRLFQASERYFEQVAGPDNRYELEALERLEDLRAIRPAPGQALESRMAAGLRRIYPQKWEYAGEAAVRALVSEAFEEARALGITSETGMALITALEFGFGHGATRDPLYPWIGGTLRDGKMADAKARAERLYRKTQAYVERMLVHLA